MTVSPSNPANPSVVLDTSGGPLAAGALGDWLVTSEHISQSGLRVVGGKAHGLAALKAAGFAVPEFIVLTRRPIGEEERNRLGDWWRAMGNPPLAVRSSARAEDSDRNSFAGQLSSFLWIRDPKELFLAVEKCFASVDANASLAYQKHFGVMAGSMNVIVQRMVDARFSGVYFSRDPRGGDDAGWLAEAVAGTGEKLVSGLVTPERLHKGAMSVPLPGWPHGGGERLAELGQKVASHFGFAVDMEWAFDGAGELWLLQSRPITTRSASEELVQAELQKEMERLRGKYGSHVVWDGQTFAEFTGFPSYLTFSVWKMAFSPSGSFNKALRKIGYVGFHGAAASERDTLLERVFGRAYVNLSLLEKMFFGKVPYTIKALPRPRLVFDWRKIDLETLLMTPLSLLRMLQVAWNLQTKREVLLNECEKRLGDFLLRQTLRPFSSDLFQSWSNADLIGELQAQARSFAEEDSFWPFVLIMMAESTMQSLQAALNTAVGAGKAQVLLNQWMGEGVSTVTMEMNREYARACSHPQERFSFLEKFGHRGPGELDLANPRWIELGDRAFYLSQTRDALAGVVPDARQTPRSVQELIMESVRGVRQNVVLSEWGYLKRILELRERWKMVVMKTYANLRWLALELGRRRGYGDDVFWFRLSEVLKESSDPDAEKKIVDRSQRFHAFRGISFPVVVSLGELERTMSQGHEALSGDTLEGDGLSPGLVYGRVRIITEASEARPEEWDDQTILVAEATDPGWTPLFHKARGIVVERGGVLSHCAIVAREMGIPAVSRILHCTRRLQNGQWVCVDGFNGRVTIQNEAAFTDTGSHREMSPVGAKEVKEGMALT